MTFDVLIPFLVAFVLVLIFFSLDPSPAAAPRAKLKGRVVLTVAGNISNKNRGALLGTDDGLFKKNNISFARAVQYDEASLKSFKQITAPDKPEKHEKPVYSGPSLNDVIKDAQAKDKPIFELIHVYGLSQNKVIPFSSIGKHDWMIALEHEGEPLGMGGRGPLLLMYRERDGSLPPEAEHKEWVWGLFYIEVK